MKVLIISHTPTTTCEAMGKTFVSLFENFKREELCQLYIYPNVPDINYCESYFRITDKDVLKSYFKLKVNSREIQRSEIGKSKDFYENPKDRAVYKNRKNKTSFRIIMRDVMWKFARWNNKALNEWIRREKPTCIFVAPGNGKFLYDMAMEISKKYNLPIVTYICDEFYFVNTPNKLLDKIRVNLVQLKMRQLMKRTSHIVTICDSLTELYSKGLNRPATTVMTGTSFEISNHVKAVEAPQAITYMGNIRCNRFNSLVEIGNVLEKINKESHTNFTLNIYTSEKDVGILSHFKDLETINLCGYVTGEEFNRVFHSADILLHTEAFDEKSIDEVKNSVSTKIADSLASGIPLLAYGPKQVASMKHLIDNNCAIVATNKAELYTALKKAFFDVDFRKQITENALRTAKECHDSGEVSLKLYKIFKSLN